MYVDSDRENFDYLHVKGMGAGVDVKEDAIKTMLFCCRIFFFIF